MCNSANCNHGRDNLDDDLDGLFDGPAQPLNFAPVDMTPKGADLGDALRNNRRFEAETARAAAGHRYEETCPKCNGSGRFIGYTGRSLGECFECKGKGKKTFKSSPEAREKARASAAQQRYERFRNLEEQANAWLEANPAEAKCLRDSAARGFEFAQSMLDALNKYGHLTEKQEAAVRSMTQKSLARQAQWAAEREARESVKAEVQIDRIAEAFRVAKSNLIDFPKLRLAGFIFSLAPLNGKNAGAIYVKSDDGVYLGKVVEGRFTRSRDCTDELEQGIVAAAADPEAAASAYGLQTGICSCCGRKLTNKDSVGLGIGPICRGKWGW